MTTVKERPIIFSGPMVRAIIDGRKTQTRRIVKLNDRGLAVLKRPYTANIREGVGLVWAAVAGEREQPMPSEKIAELCPCGKPGDGLWVKETWRRIEPSGVVQYAADAAVQTKSSMPWKSSRFMPRRASRLSLDVLGVRVEQLNDISEADAIAEGVESRDEYRHLWELLHGEGSWDANPWVWVLDFKLREG